MAPRCCCCQAKKTKFSKDMKYLEEVTKFTMVELQGLHFQFRADYPGGFITLPEFTLYYQKMFPHGNATFFSKKMFNMLDLNKDLLLDFKEFVIGIDKTNQSQAEEKIRWAFDFFDENRNGYINVVELISAFHSITTLMGTKTFNLSIKVKRIFNEMDEDSDGLVNYEEFSKALKKDGHVLWRNMIIRHES